MLVETLLQPPAPHIFSIQGALWIYPAFITVVCVPPYPQLRAEVALRTIVTRPEVARTWVWLGCRRCGSWYGWRWYSFFQGCCLVGVAKLCRFRERHYVSPAHYSLAG
jgi:hypothetical protein